MTTPAAVTGTIGARRWNAPAAGVYLIRAASGMQEKAEQMAVRARADVVAKRDLPTMTRKLESRYREVLRSKRRS